MYITPMTHLCFIYLFIYILFVCLFVFLQVLKESAQVKMTAPQSPVKETARPPVLLLKTRDVRH